MKTIVKELVIGRQINIDCERNDSVDIRCGGPPYIGYDFFVDADLDVKDVKTFLEKCFHDAQISYINIYVSPHTAEVDPKCIWTFDRIKDFLEKEKLNK